MKRILSSIFTLLLATTMFAQQFNTQGTGNKAANPTVMILPDLGSEATPEKLETALKDEPAIAICIAKVKQLFTDKAFPVKDYLAELKNLRNEGLLDKAEGVATSVQQQLVENGGADIMVLVKLMDRADGGLDVIVDAQEAKVGQSFALKTYSCDIRTGDRVKKVNYMLDDLNDFMSVVETGFRKMVAEGRSLRVKINFAKGCDIDAYTEVGTNGNDLETELRDWISANAFKGNGTLNSSDTFIMMEFKVPVYDQTTGKPFQIGRMRGILLKSLQTLLQPQGVKAKTLKSQGQIMNFVIGNE